MRRTIIIIILIAAAAALGYAYEQVSLILEKSAHPLEYEEYVVKYSEEYNIPPEIIYSVIKTESSFKSDAVSVAGAVGLMQITPETFDWLMTKTGERLDTAMLNDPNTNIKYGSFFLNYLYAEFADWEISFAAYNAGLNRVKNTWMKDPNIIHNNKIISIPIEETRNYVKKVSKSAETYKRLYFSEK
jgi:soluble lytic murein transglycosylase